MIDTGDFAYTNRPGPVYGDGPVGNPASGGQSDPPDLPDDFPDDWQDDFDQTWGDTQRAKSFLEGLKGAWDWATGLFSPSPSGPLRNTPPPGPNSELAVKVGKIHTGGGGWFNSSHTMELYVVPGIPARYNHDELDPNGLHDAIDWVEIQHPEAEVIVSKDVNNGKLAGHEVRIKGQGKHHMSDIGLKDEVSAMLAYLPGTELPPDVNPPGRQNPGNGGDDDRDDDEGTTATSSGAAPMIAGTIGLGIVGWFFRDDLPF